MIWTPRPPAPDEPACWSWPIPDVVPLIERMPGLSAAAIEMIDEGRGGGNPRWGDFHAGRCAICAIDWQNLVDDHCHDTGQIRGLLCRSCNTCEGVTVGLIYDRYRMWHPAAILDHHQPYTGFGWIDGWSRYEHGRDVDELGERPPTPWPAWQGDVPAPRSARQRERTITPEEKAQNPMRAAWSRRQIRNAP